MSTLRSDLEMLDKALVSVRRFLEVPHVVDDDGRAIELSTLLILAGLPTEGQSIRDIATRLDVAPSTASRLVARAALSAVVTKSRGSADARSALVTATEGGRQLAVRAAEYRVCRLDAALGGWSEDRIRTFARSLDDFAKAHARGRAQRAQGNI